MPCQGKGTTRSDITELLTRYAVTIAVAVSQYEVQERFLRVSRHNGKKDVPDLVSWSVSYKDDVVNDVCVAKSNA